MKDSNIRWIDNIPLHWKVKELKYCLLPGSEGIKIGPFGSALKSEMLVEEGYKVYGQENLIKDDFSLGHRFISEEKFKELEVYEIAEKDVLISMMGTVGKCKVVTSNIQKGIMDSHLIRIRFNENLILPEFAAYLIQDSNYIKMQIDLNSKGSIMSGLNSSIIKNLKLILPSIEEQRIILGYMDSGNEILNQMIASKSYMINLLNQQRQSIITEAVTKGLNPNVKMKNSGVEWIGEIPEHWELKKIKHITQVKRGASPRPIDDPKYFDDNGEYAWVRIADVSKAGMYLNETIQVMSDLGASLSIKQYPGDLFVSIAGTVGKPCITNVKCCIHDGFVYFPNYKFNNFFLYYIFASGQPYKGLGKMGTQLNLNTDTIGEIKIPWPSGKEQDGIVSNLEVEVSRVDKLIKMVDSQIELLKEYRQALIYEAVTGKIDVRDMELD